MEKKQKPKTKRRQQRQGKIKERRHHAEILPADIVYEILIRLSVQLLTKFRCVCKQWCSLISRPSFQQDHYLRRSQKDPLVLLRMLRFNRGWGAYTIDLSTYDGIEWNFLNSFSKTVPRQWYGYILSCQGLVCLWGRIIIVCNPATRETMILPPTHGSTDKVGFGYAASKKQFKVVRFFGQYNGSCEVFTLGTSEWRGVMPPPNIYLSGWCSSPFLHGEIHLLSNDGDFDFGIVTFDIESEEYKTGKIQLPQYCHVAPLNHSFKHIYLSELGRFLCLTISLGATLSLWLLKDYDNGGWVNEYIIDFSSFDYFVSGQPLVILGDGSILLDVSDQCDDLLCSYHPGEKTFTEQKVGYYSAAMYVESLFALGNSP